MPELPRGIGSSVNGHRGIHPSMPLNLNVLFLAEFKKMSLTFIDPFLFLVCQQTASLPAIGNRSPLG
jgi:hypothetical protein